MNLKIKYNAEEKVVTINDKLLDFDYLMEISKKVIEEREDLSCIYEGFDDILDVKRYYDEMFSKINQLKDDEQIKEAREGMKKFYETEEQ